MSGLWFLPVKAKQDEIMFTTTDVKKSLNENEQEEVMSKVEEEHTMQSHLKQLTVAFEYNLMLLKERDDDINYLETIIREQDTSILNEKNSYKTHLSVISSQHEMIEEEIYEELKQEQYKNNLLMTEIKSADIQLRKAEQEITCLNNKLNLSMIKLNHQQKIIDKLKSEQSSLTLLLNEYKTRELCQHNVLNEENLKEPSDEENLVENDYLKINDDNETRDSDEIDKTSDDENNENREDKEHLECHNCLEGDVCVVEDGTKDEVAQTGRDEEVLTDAEKENEGGDEVARRNVIESPGINGGEKQFWLLNKPPSVITLSSVSIDSKIETENVNESVKLTPEKIDAANPGDVESYCQTCRVSRKCDGCGSEVIAKSSTREESCMGIPRAIENPTSRHELIDYVKNSRMEILRSNSTEEKQQESCFNKSSERTLEIENSGKEIHIDLCEISRGVGETYCNKQNGTKNNNFDENPTTRNTERMNTQKESFSSSRVDRVYEDFSAIHLQSDTVVKENLSSESSENSKLEIDVELSKQRQSDATTTNNVVPLNLINENDILKKQNMILRNIIRELKDENSSVHGPTKRHDQKDKSGLRNINSINKTNNVEIPSIKIEDDSRISDESIAKNSLHQDKKAINKNNVVRETKAECIEELLVKTNNETVKKYPETSEDEREFKQETLGQKLYFTQKQVHEDNEKEEEDEEDLEGIFKRHKSQLVALFNVSKIFNSKGPKELGSNWNQNKENDFEKSEFVWKQQKHLDDLHLNNCLGNLHLNTSLRDIGRETADKALRVVGNKTRKKDNMIVFDNTSTLSKKEIDKSKHRQFADRGKTQEERHFQTTFFRDNLNLRDNLKTLENNGKENEIGHLRKSSLLPLLNTVREMRRDIVLLKSRNRKSGRMPSPNPNREFPSTFGGKSNIRTGSMNSLTMDGLQHRGVGTLTNLRNPLRIYSEKSRSNLPLKDASNKGLKSNECTASNEGLVVYGKTFGTRVVRGVGNSTCG